MNIMKKLVMLLTATTMAASFVAPVSAKSQTLYLLTRFTHEGTDEDATDMRFSYNKKGLITKIVGHEKIKLGKEDENMDESFFSYKGTKLVQRREHIDAGDNRYTFKYSKQKITAIGDSRESDEGEYYRVSKETYGLKSNCITKIKSLKFSYNKKGQLIKQYNRNDQANCLTGFKYDQKGFVKSFTAGQRKTKKVYQYKTTYKHNLPSVMKETLKGKTIHTYHFYYQKKKVSAVSAVKDQQYSFLHKLDPKGEILYAFNWDRLLF